MSEKKRVRVYRPKVNTDHFANYMFEVGGPVGQASMPMMQQPQDISKDIADILQMYAQSKGLDEQQLQQMFAAIMQMEPDQQQQAIAQMQQELGSELAANPMVAKQGGYIKETKKLLSKKIGGVSTNVTSKDLVGQRLELIKNNIGGKYANALLKEATEEQLAKDNEMLGQASQNLAMASMPPMPAMDYGGYVNDMYNMGMGIASGKENPFIQDVIDTKMQFRNDLSALGSNLSQMRFRPSKKGVKIRKSGDIFNKQQMPENPAQVSTNPPSDGMSRGGSMPSYQNAGTTWTVKGINTALDDLNIRDEDYHVARKAYEQGTHTPEQLNIMNRVEDYAVKYGDKSASSTTTTTTTNNNTNQQTGAGGINGWHGGFYWQNGVPVTSVWDQNAMQQMKGQQEMQGMDFASLFSSPDRSMRIKGNLLDMARNPYIAKQFGKALTDFQPDNVYLSKAKGRVNPFGAKVVLKWDYDENGRPVQEGDDESSRRIGSGNLMGRMFKNNDLYQQALSNRAEKNARRLGYMVPADEPSVTGPAYSAAQPPLTEEQQKYLRESLTLPENATPTVTTPESNTGTFGPLENVGPRNEEFAYGGMPKARAGKMVIKQQFMPVTSDAFQAYTPIANALASGFNMRGIDEQEQMAHLADFYTPSIPMGPGSMGTKPVGPFAGSESRFNPMFGATGNYADSLYQNEPVYGIAAGMGYQPYRKYGGMYQEGGVADYQEGGTYEELSDDELDQIFLKGGKVQYY